MITAIHYFIYFYLLKLFVHLDLNSLKFLFIMVNFVTGDVPPLKIKCYSNMGTLSCKSLPLQQLLIEELVSRK